MIEIFKNVKEKLVSKYINATTPGIEAIRNKVNSIGTVLIRCN